MHNRIDAGAIAFICALLLLAALAGALLMVSNTFPAGFIRDGYRAGTALYARWFHYRDRFATDLWVEARTNQRGVTVLDPDRLYEGLTLYTSGDSARALLMDITGKIVHEWRRPYSSVWENTSAVRNPVPDDHTFFRKAHLFPNGDLLALYEGVGDTPYGYGLVRLTPDSATVWKNLDNLHHDFDVTPHGDIIALSHGFRKTPLAHADQFEPPYLEDALVVIGEDGATRDRLSLLDALNDSPYRSLLWRIPYYSMEDPLHANSVDYLDAGRAEHLAKRLPAAREGQVLVSMREIAGGTIALVDLELRQVVWAARGPWLAQHDPDVMPDGTIQIFDNRGNLGAPSRSRILRFDPATFAIEWSFTGDPDNPLDSPIRASHQPLPNGNTLITESGGGRLLETTEDGRIAWEYVNPLRGGSDDSRIPVVCWAQRIPESYLDRSFVDRLPPRTSPTPVHGR